MDTHDQLLFRPYTSNSYLIQEVTILLSPSTLKFEISQPQKNSRLELGKHHTSSHFQGTPWNLLLIAASFPIVNCGWPHQNARGSQMHRKGP